MLASRSALVTATTLTAVALVAIVMLRLVWHRAAADVVVGTLAAPYVNAGKLGLPVDVYLFGDAVAVVPPLLFQLLVSPRLRSRPWTGTSQRWYLGRSS